MGGLACAMVWLENCRKNGCQSRIPSCSAEIVPDCQNDRNLIIGFIIGYFIVIGYKNAVIIEEIDVISRNAHNCA